MIEKVNAIRTEISFCLMNLMLFPEAHGDPQPNITWMRVRDKPAK